MSRVEVLSGRNDAGAGARSRSDQSSRKLLHRALRFARLPGGGMWSLGIYRWRRDLRTAAMGFAEVVGAPEPQRENGRP